MMGRWKRTVYFARRSDDTGPIKIGCSSCPVGRVKQLGYDHGTKFKLLCLAKGDLSTERGLHRRFANCRALVPTSRKRRTGRVSPIPGSREWFDPTPELLALIDDINAGRTDLPEHDNRDESIAQRYLYTRGSTLESVGQEFGLTRERVRQILNANGYPSNRLSRAYYLAQKRAA